MFGFISTKAQIGIGTSNPDTTAILDISSSSKGLLIPRVTLSSTLDATTILKPATGLLVYNTTPNFLTDNFVIAGFYYNSGTPAEPFWNLLTGYNQNAFIYNRLGFESQTAQQGAINVSGRGIFGDSLRTGNDLSINGMRFGRKTSSANNNIAIGKQSLENLTTAVKNIGIGDSALFTSTTGGLNIAIGYGSLALNTTGNNQTAIGVLSLSQNTTGIHNIAIGSIALRDNTVGNYNTSVGSNSSLLNTSGIENAVVGAGAFRNNTTGSYNAGVGRFALFGNTTASYNTAIGNRALYTNATGTYNTALGYAADVSADGLTNATAVGNGAIVSTSNTVQLGNAAVTKINTSGVVYSNGVALTSDIRLKRNIEPIPSGLSLINQLKAVHYEKKLNINGNDYTKKEFGFIAQEIKKIIPDIVAEANDAQKTLSVDYNSIIAILTRAVQEQQAIIQKLQQDASTRDAKMEALEKKLSALIEKLSTSK